MNTVAYQQHCLARPIVTSVTLGSIFTGLSVAQGARFTPRLAALNIGGLYAYNVLQVSSISRAADVRLALSLLRLG